MVSFSKNQRASLINARARGYPGVFMILGTKPRQLAQVYSLRSVPPGETEQYHGTKVGLPALSTTKRKWYYEWD